MIALFPPRTLAKHRADELTILALFRTTRLQVRVDGPDGTHKHEAVEIKGWVSSIRKYVAHVITATYQVIDMKTASAMLGGLAGAELAAFAAEQGWQVSLATIECVDVAMCPVHTWQQPAH